MAKYLLEASYSAEGFKGLMKEGAAGRKSQVEKTLKKLGGKLEAIYWALGDRDAVVICELPDAVSAAALSVAVSATGAVKTKTTALLTVAEVDKALSQNVSYRPPGA